MSIIEVKHLTKEYQLGHIASLKETALNGLRLLTGKGTHKKEPFKALDDVHFSIEEGEVVGIIGHNGAGKSTLLKHLANISKPTKGQVIVRGNVAPLIEVGAGVSPELTGRENIFLNAAILGIPKKTIMQKLDEIIDFAEIEEFIDTPVKRYSSGMTVKLGFSIATSMDADILIVDEVLAVGDLAFQRKCFDRMESLIKKQGKTVLLVSHNIRQVEHLCSRVLLMDHGHLLMDGDPKTVCNQFYSLSERQIKNTQDSKSQLRQNVLSSNDIDLVSIEAFDGKGLATSSVQYFEDVEFRLTFNVKNRLPKPVFGFGFHTTDMLYLATMQSINALECEELMPGTHQVQFKVSRFPFLPGIYSIRIGVVLGEFFHPVFYAENLFPIHVTAPNISRSINSGSNEGFIGLDVTWGLIS
ncbi:MAG: ABC transporter ATP-binding protein [Methylovulum miyakonense]|uniref:ABC transporter ATP-binding protein n=1 Tax=Methylovulum miyakonense TaxID=645578 RepID=UPI003BB64FBA